MEQLSNLSGRWLEIVTAVYLIGMVLHGHHRGFIRIAVSATALLITIVAVKCTQPYVIDWLKYDTKIYETMKENMVERVGIDEILNDMAPGESIGKEDEWLIIENLPIPEQMRDLLMENNNMEVYRMMEVELFRDYVGSYLADVILKAAVFIVLFLIIYLVLKVVMIWLDLIAKLPILSGLNQIAGAVLGGAQAMIFIWIACLILTMFSGTELGKEALSQINATPWLSWIYDHNMLSYLVLGLIRSVW